MNIRLVVKIVGLLIAMVVSLLLSGGIPVAPVATVVPVFSIPWAQQDVIPGQPCTLIGIPTLGFPFRKNLYDACRQDPSNIVWIVVLNWIILMAAFYGAYRIILGRIRLTRAETE